MKARMLGVMLLAIALIGAGFTLSSAGAAVGGFTCRTDVVAGGSLIIGLSFFGKESCDRPMSAIFVTSAVYGPSGTLEGSGPSASCSDCATAESSGSVPVIIIGSQHTLVVDESATAPGGDVWGAIDGGPYGTCTGVYTPTAHCTFTVPIEQDIGPLGLLGLQPAQTSVANGSQTLVDGTGAN